MVGCVPDDVTMLVHAVERAPDGVLVVDDGGTIIYANAAMAAVAGSDQLVGASVDTLLPPALRARHSRLRSAYHEQPVARSMGIGLELALCRADGTEVPVEVALSPVDAGGTHVVATVRDVSARIEEHARLAAAQEQLSLVAERERIGRDLHDVVLQHLYGVGLTVQAIAAGTAPGVRDRLQAVVGELDDVISEVRTIVFTLGDSSAHGAFRHELTAVVAQARRVLGFTPSVRLDGPVDAVLTDAIRTEMMASMREALGNVARHARATQASVIVSTEGSEIVMTVADDGIGPPTDEARMIAGNGLRNLRQRAGALGGTCSLEPRNGGGALLRWQVPFT